MSKIDFVVTWVDGNDPAWKAEKAKYQKSSIGDLRNERYREWDNLKYWFRAIEKYAPWVNKIHFVTWGHLPTWLNTNNPKLHIVKHSDFIPEEYLPTFSCRPIELNLHKISGLSEKFVYFNDDMFLTASVKENDFFVDGLPCDAAILNATSVRVKDIDGKIVPEQSLYMTSMYNTAIINRHFDKKDVMKQNWRKWFNPIYGKQIGRTLLLMPWSVFLGFHNSHLPYSYLKSTFDTVWKEEPMALHTACSHKFREAMDVSSRVLSYWQIASGNFAPRSNRLGAYFRISDHHEDNLKIYEAIVNQKYKMVCVNDEVTNEYYETAKRELNKCFHKLLPKKSSFEK